MEALPENIRWTDNVKPLTDSLPPGQARVLDAIAARLPADEPRDCAASWLCIHNQRRDAPPRGTGHQGAHSPGSPCGRPEDHAHMNAPAKALPYTVERFSTREEWLAGRTGGIGASEAAAILGVSKWQSPFAIWARKRGILPPDHHMTSEQRWGLLMEPAIARWFAEETGYRIERNDGYTVLRSKAYPWLCCTLDAWILPDLAGVQYEGILDVIYHDPHPLEFKNADRMVAYEWQKSVPLAYQVQQQVQMVVTGAPVSVIAVCLGGNDGKWHPVLRNETFIRRMLPRLEAFWKGVQEGNPPEVDGSESTREALRDMYDPPKNGKRIELPQEMMPWVQQFDAATAIASRAKAGRDEAANHIRQAMGDAEIAEVPDGKGGGFTWKLDRGGKRTFKRKDKLPKSFETAEDYEEYEPATESNAAV